MSRLGTWVFLIAVTWYLAGMFRTTPLTVLLLSELGLLAVMAIVSLYFRHTLDASFASEIAFGEKERDNPCKLALRASGRLPAGRPRVTLGLSYRTQRGRTIQRFYGGAEARRETEVEFYVYPPYCGPLDIELRQILTWDYLFLFPAKRRKRERMTLIVLPPPRVLNVTPQTFADASVLRTQSELVIPSDGASPEVRDLREYRPGDSARSIHWKLAARTDTLWSREYEDEREERFTMSLDLSAANARTRPERWDAFYEVLSAIILGLLRHRNAVRIHWRDGTRDRVQDVSDEQSRKEFFMRLYQSDAPSGTPETVLTDFALDFNLRWRRGAALIWQFDASGALWEIAENHFIV